MDTIKVSKLQGVSVQAASGVIGPFQSEACDQLQIDIYLRVLTGGAAPTVTFTLQKFDEFDNVISIGSGSALNAAGTPATATGFAIGPGLFFTGLLPHKFQIAWVTTGAPTTATADVSIIGKGGGGR